MIVYPEMLIKVAQAANIKVPLVDGENLAEDFNIEEYPYWTVFCNMQLGQPMPNWSCHWDNAKVVAKISDDKIRTITGKEIIGLGFQVGY